MLVTCLGFALLMWFPGALNAPTNAPSCLPPRLSDGVIAPRKDIYPDGSQLTYACHEGRKPPVKGWWEQVTCQDGQWSREPQCIDKNACILPEIPNAMYTKNPNGWYKNGRKIRVRCFDGYEDKNQRSTAQCVNGHWMSMPVCERDVNACGLPPKILNAVVIEQMYQEVFSENSEVEYVCGEGYTTNNGAVQKSYCSMGNWTEVSECTRETQPITGDGGSDADGTETSSGHRTTTGRGAPPTVVNCGTTPTIANGDIVEENLQYLKYQCSAFYTLQGSDTVTCNSNGSWSDPPTCLDNFCAVDTATYRNLDNVGTHYIKSGHHREFRCARSSDTSYLYCDNRQITQGRCCSAFDRYWGYCQ